LARRRSQPTAAAEPNGRYASSNIACNYVTEIGRIYNDNISKIDWDRDEKIERNNEREIETYACDL